MTAPKQNRRKPNIVRLEHDCEDARYWLKQTPEARLAAQEINRRAAYNYDDSLRMLMTVEITNRAKS
jgi:hypothetical protein